MSSKENLDTWLATVESIRRKHQELAFFTPAGVLNLYRLLQKSVQNVEDIARELMFLFERYKNCLEMLCNAIKSTLEVSCPSVRLPRTEWAVSFALYGIEVGDRQIKPSPALWLLPVKVFLFKQDREVLDLANEGQCAENSHQHPGLLSSPVCHSLTA